MSVKYELKFKTKGYPWSLFNTYKTKDDEHLIQYHKAYGASNIVEDVRVIEVTTTRKEIAL